ncbi:hypothetical protein [Alistipes indistinctus]|uniref:hypothetical protein n=1 Tax=Alistipes indistinctus TaxID=626932 RepID=UPI00351F9E17
MSKSFFRQFQNEDWIATTDGLLLVVTVIVLPGLIPVFPKELNTVEAWLSILGLLVVALLVAALGVRLLGERLKGFLPAFVAIFVLSVLCMLLSGIPAIKRNRIRVGFLFSGPRIADPQYRGIARVAFARSPQ